MNKDKAPPGHVWLDILVPENRLVEFNELKKQMIRGDASQLEAIVDERERIASAALDGLRTICEAIRKNPTTGQRYRLTKFLAGLYNGPEHPFDMTELRGLDGSLRLACLAVLTLDSLAISEIQNWGVVDDDQLQKWFWADGVHYRREARGLAKELYDDKYGEAGHKTRSEDA